MIVTWEMWGGAGTELTTCGRDTSDSICLPFNQRFSLVRRCHRAMQPRLNQTQDLKSSCLSLPSSWASRTVLPGLMATSYFIIMRTTMVNISSHFFHSHQTLDLAPPLPCEVTGKGPIQGTWKAKLHKYLLLSLQLPVVFLKCKLCFHSFPQTTDVAANFPFVPGEHSFLSAFLHSANNVQCPRV